MRHGWSDYSCAGFDDILDCAQEHDMVVSFHSMDDDQMDSMVKKHPNTTLVAAHPGEYREFMRHLRRMKLSRNYFLDLSGGVLYRYGMLRRGVRRVRRGALSVRHRLSHMRPGDVCGRGGAGRFAYSRRKTPDTLRQRAPAVESVSRVPLRLTEREISLLKIAASPSDSLPETI